MEVLLPLALLSLVVVVYLFVICISYFPLPLTPVLSGPSPPPLGVEGRLVFELCYFIIWNFLVCRP